MRGISILRSGLSGGIVAAIVSVVSFASTCVGDDSASGLETIRWQSAIDAASAAGGGLVTVPAGRHLVGQLNLRSNVELHLDEGAVLEGVPGLENYRVTTLTCSEGTWSAVIFALNATNVAVTGGGTIFGNGSAWPAPPKDYAGCQEGLRPRGLFFGDCKGVRLEGFTLRDSACWGIVLKRTEDVVARHVTINNHSNYNNDGFDIEARNVLIEDCDVDSGDDAYCVKSNDPDFIVENVVIRRCVGRSQCNVFKIGTASHGVIRNITFENCRTEPTTRDFPGLYPEYPGKDHFFWRVTPRSPFGVANSAISVECVDGGFLENVHFDGILCRNGAKVPIFVRGGTRTGRKTGARVGDWHVLRNVLIENVKGEADGVVASSVTGVDGCRVQNVRIRNVDIVCHGAGEQQGRVAMMEKVPYLPGGYPDVETSFGSHILPAYGLYVDRADDVVLEDVEFRLAPGEADPRPAVMRTDACKAVGGIRIRQDHADALYRVGETATFRIEIADEKAGELLRSGRMSWSLGNFGPQTFATGEVDLAKGNPFEVSGTMKEPGFLKLKVWDGKRSAVWSVGFDVRKIRQNEPRPTDFDAYWKGEVERLEREVPLDARCVRDETVCQPGFDVYRVSFATFADKRVYGFMSVPTNSATAPFGVHVEVPGAGPGYVSAPCRKGWISLVMNVHTFETEKTYERQKETMVARHAELAKRFALKDPKAYCALAGIGESREGYQFHDVLLGINRAVDWVGRRPDADATRFVYTGSSQGGGFGLFLCYLNPRILKARVAVPAITGHYGFRQGRQNGWPNLVSGQPDAKRPEAERFAAYFDGINFAAGIRIPIRFIVGFADETCSPDSVYSAYNACPSSDKRIVHAIGSPHSWFSNPYAKAAECENNRFFGFE